MRKVQVWAVFWTIIIAIPFTTLALITAAYLTDHLAEIAGSIASIDFFTFAKYRGSEQFASEFKMRNYTGMYDSSGKFDNPTNGFSRR